MTRGVASLFRFDVLYLSNAGDVSEAIRSGRACVCAGRSLGDEPEIVSQRFRDYIVVFALQGVERSLSLGESNEAELIALDKLLADEEAHNSLLVGLRGHRGSMYQVFSRMGSGAMTSDGVHEELGVGKGSLLGWVPLYPRWRVRQQEPLILQVMTRLVENARLPPHEQIVVEKEIDREMRDRKLTFALVASRMGSPIRIGEECRRKTASVSTMRGLIAIERYRMKYGKWPAKLADVVPEFLKSVPLDPFDGTPLKMAKVADSVTVYSVGVDGVDDGGKLDRKKPTAPGTDIGFQLWDKEKRAQHASTKPNGEE